MGKSIQVANAILRIAMALKDEQVGRVGDWEVALRGQKGVGMPAKRASLNTEREHLVELVQTWISWGDVRPQLRWSTRLGKLRVSLTGDSLFGLLALRWRDVDLGEGALQVRSTPYRITNGVATKDVPSQGFNLGSPKTEKSWRQIALTTRAVSALRRHRAALADERLAIGEGWEDNDLVFCNRVGRPIEASNLLRREFKPLLERAGLPSIRFRDLRHTAATICLQQLVPPKEVSEMLGHAQVGITLNTYGHVLPDMHKEATLAMEKALAG